jgi:glyoxylate reductase
MGRMSPPSVFLTRRVPGDAAGILQRAGLRVRVRDCDTAASAQELADGAAEADGLLCSLADRIDSALLAGSPALRIVSTFAVGFDNIDVDACTAAGVQVTNTPGVLDDTTADLTFALVLAGARRLVEAASHVREGRWGEWTPSALLGRDVHHATLGVVGLGRIGQGVARRAAGFSMRVLYASRTRRPDLETALGVEHRTLEQLLRESDFVCLTVPLSAQTRGLIGAPELALMKPTAVLVNTSRGAIVDQRALLAACRDGVIGAAALDVTDPEPMAADDPLLALANVTVLPHVGSATSATRVAMGELAARNLAAVLTGQAPLTPVNRVRGSE